MDIQATCTEELEKLDAQIKLSETERSNYKGGTLTWMFYQARVEKYKAQRGVHEKLLKQFK